MIGGKWRGGKYDAMISNQEKTKKKLFEPEIQLMFKAMMSEG